MKVMFDNIIFDLQKIGGVSKSWEKLLSFARADKSLENEEFGSQLRINNYVTGAAVETELLLWHKFLRSIRRYLPLLKQSEGIIHSSYFRSPLLKRSKQRYVVTVHDCMYEIHATGLRRFVHTFFKKIAIKKADAIICVSHHTKKDLERFYDLKNKIVKVIYNGVDDEFSFIESIGGCKSVQPIILYVGARDGCKNFQFILKVFRALRDIREANLVCVGPQFSFAEEAMISKFELSESIKNLGAISGAELNEWYNRSTLLLVASEYEGFGITLLEAQATMTPVVFPNNSSLPEVVAYDDTMYETNNVKECLEKILMILDVGMDINVLKSGLNLSKKLSWKRNYIETRRLYIRLLQGIK
jgi:mannosyltransferase